MGNEVIIACVLRLVAGLAANGLGLSSKLAFLLSALLARHPISATREVLKQWLAGNTEAFFVVLSM